MTPFSLYNASLAAAEKYRNAEALFRSHVATMTSFQPDNEYFRLKTARDKAKREFQKADKEWKREWAKSQQK